MPSPDFSQDRMTRKQAAEYVGLRTSALEADVSRQRLRIPFYRIATRVFYRKSDLDAWIEQHRVA